MKNALILCAFLIAVPLSADDRVIQACVGDATQFSPIREYILVSEHIGNNGLVTKFEVFMTYESFNFCKSAILGEARSEVGNHPANLSKGLKCYASSVSPKLFHLVNEKRNPSTGLVVSLEVMNEFDSLLNCLLNLK